jgi:electron transfer flavoprotein beta subunit
MDEAAISCFPVFQLRLSSAPCRACQMPTFGYPFDLRPHPVGACQVPYHCVVCVKQVPDTKNVGGDAMKDDGTVNRAALPAIFNPEDLNALEMALAIRDAYGGYVTVLTMGLPKACDVLREAMFLGAERGVLITDRRAAGSDTLATSYILSCAVKKLKADIVLCGRQAIDGDTAQVGPQLAEKLDWPQITYVDELQKIENNHVTARRNVGNGYEVVACELPVMLTVNDTANVPRPAAAKRLMKYKKARCSTEVEQEVIAEMGKDDMDKVYAESSKRFAALAEKGLIIEQWSLDEIEADLQWCGLAGSPTKVHRIQSIVLAGGDYKEYPPTDEGVAAVINELIEEHTIG